MGYGAHPYRGPDLPAAVQFVRAGLTMRLGFELWATRYFGGAVFTTDSNFSAAAEGCTWLWLELNCGLSCSNLAHGVLRTVGR